MSVALFCFVVHITCSCGYNIRGALIVTNQSRPVPAAVPRAIQSPSKARNTQPITGSESLLISTILSADFEVELEQAKFCLAILPISDL